VRYNEEYGSDIFCEPWEKLGPSLFLPLPPFFPLKEMMIIHGYLFTTRRWKSTPPLLSEIFFLPSSKQKG